MKREDLIDVGIVAGIVALFWGMFAYDQWQHRSEIEQGSKQQQRMIVEELQKIETEQKQEGWQTSIQDLDKP